MSATDKLMSKVCYGVNLYKEIVMYGLTWWIHIEEKHTKDNEDVIYEVSLTNEEQEIVYTKIFYFYQDIMNSNYFITIAKQTIAEYNIIRKGNLAINVAAHNFECYEGNWLEEEDK